MNQDLIDVNEQTPGQDLRKPKDPPPKSILKMGEDAKYSEGKSAAEIKASRGAMAEALRKEEEQIVIENLNNYLKAMTKDAAAGYVVKTIKSLEISLKDKLRMYNDQPKHPAIWQITKVLSDIALKHAVKMLNNRQFDAAFSYMKIVQKYTEPVAGSDWSKNQEWCLLRKNLHKNYAIYHQKNALWQQAADNLKMALRFEKQLGLEEDATNTSLTCAIIHQKMKNYGQSIDYAQQCLKSVEKELSIKKGQALSDSRYIGKELDRQKYNDKQFTMYGIGLHIIGKNLLNLQYWKESKHFITKAHYVVTKMLILERKTDLQLAIQMDMRTVLEKTRYLQEVEREDKQTKLAKQRSGKKVALKKELALTDEDIERSLSAIKSGLATVDGRDSVQEKYNEIGDELKKMKIDDTEYQEEFKEIFETEDGAKIIDKDEEFERQMNEVNESLAAMAEPDQKEATVKRQSLARQEDAADRRETDPEYIAKLDDFKKAQETLRLKQENFQQRQREFELKKHEKQQLKEKRLKELKDKQDKVKEQEQQKSTRKDHLQIDEKKRARAQTLEERNKSKADRLAKAESLHRTKRAPLNLAKIGANRDFKGLTHVGERGTKAFFSQRKKNILSLNREQYNTIGDEVKLDVDEYKVIKNEKDGGDRVLSPKKLPEVVSLSIKTDEMQDKGKKSYDQTSKIAKQGGLFKTGLKSTQMVVEAAEKQVFKNVRPSAIEPGKRQSGSPIKKGDASASPAKSQKSDLPSPYKTKSKAVLTKEARISKMAKIQRKQDRLNRQMRGEQVSTDSSEIQAMIDHDNIEDDIGVDEFQISDKNKELLARKDRNYLVKHKTYEQIVEEDPANRKIYGEDAQGNKVLLQDPSGNFIEQPKLEIVEPQAIVEEEDEIDTMMSLKDLTKGIRQIVQKDKQGLLESEQEAKARIKEEEKEQEKEQEKAQEKAQEKTQGQSILRDTSKKKIVPGKKKITFSVDYDDKGTEIGKDNPVAKAKARARGRQTPQKNDSKGKQIQAEEEQKKKYEPPNTIKGRRLKREEQKLINETGENLEEKFANKKHTVGSYYENISAKKREENGLEPKNVPPARYDVERINNLAIPVDKEQLKLAYNLKKEMKKGQDEQLFDKQLQIATKLEKKHKIDFADYIDREVPPIRADTGEFAKDYKTSKGLAEFETRNTNKLGLFDNLLKDQPGDSYQLKNKKEEIKKQAVKNVSLQKRDKPLRNTDTHLPAYMKVARAAQLEAAQPTNKARLAAYRKSMNDNVVQTMGLKNHIPFQEPQYLNLKDLRDLEHRSAAQIQNLARGYFTRKWYLNYVVRKKLGVPFSGLEFAQNPFLRQFSKPNTWLNRLQQVDQSNFLTAIPSSSDLKLSTAQIKRMRNRQQEQQIKIRGQTKLPDNTDASKVITRAMRKGMTPATIIKNLQNDFLAQGLDAYDQFKRLSVGLDHDAQGEVNKRVVEGGNETLEPLEGPETNASRKNIYGQFQHPPWLGDLTEYEGGRQKPLIDTSESEAFIEKKRADKEKIKQIKEAGSSLATLSNYVVTKDGPSKNLGPGKPGGGPEGGPGGGEGNITDMLNRARDPDGEDEFFQPQRYQGFSREAIVFYKKIVNDHKMLRWTVLVGDAFKQRVNENNKYFIPVTLLGQVLGSFQLVSYKMNIELIKISDRAEADNFKFETVWPFILYLFNYWVKNQAALMIQTQTHPQRQIYQAEMNRIMANKGFIEFFTETSAIRDEVERLEDLDRLQLINPDSNALAGRKKKTIWEEAAKVNNKSQYDDLLDFSSEIEFDERFDQELYLQDQKGVGTLYDGQHKIDRSKPENQRANTKVQRQTNRKQLFDEYKKSIEDYEKSKKKVTFDQSVLDAQYANDPDLAAREAELEKKIAEEVARDRYQINIHNFINEKFLYLPTNNNHSTYKLLKALQKSNYREFEKGGGKDKKSLALLNEERRRRLHLPPLTSIDYNCMERAAFKLKLIVNCLMLSRRMSGWALLAKDIIINQMIKQQDQRHKRHQKNAVKLNRINHLIYQQWGIHVEMKQNYNPESAQVQQSLQKIRQFQAMEKFSDGNADGITDQIKKDLEGEEIINKEIFDQDMALIDKIGQGEDPILERNPYEYDAIAARQRRIVNEFENYMEDNSIMDQQAVRLPEDTSTLSSLIFIQTIFARKIKSNIENILQILWERQAEAKKAAELDKVILCGTKFASFWGF